MGFNCHVATHYKVEYGNACFNGSDQEFVNHTLRDLCPGLWHSDECVGTSQDLEVPKEELKAAIADIESNQEKYNQKIIEEGLTLSADIMVKNFKALLESGDPDNDFIRLTWY